MTQCRPEGAEHDEIRRRIEVTGGAVLELPPSLPMGQVSGRSAVQNASHSVRLSKPGEPQIVLRDGHFCWVSGIEIASGDLPEWAVQSIVKAADAIRKGV